jgi:DNA-binding transcriptional regulator YiaG
MRASVASGPSDDYSYRNMKPVRSLEELEAEVEARTRREGPAAVADLQAQRERFRLARELTQRRRAKRLTQSELARRSGVPQGVISKLESGAGNATETTLLKVLQPLGWTLGLVPLRKARRAS